MTFQLAGNLPTMDRLFPEGFFVGVAVLKSTLWPKQHRVSTGPPKFIQFCFFSELGGKCQFFPPLPKKKTSSLPRSRYICCSKIYPMTESERCTDPIKAPWIPNHREVQLPRRIRNCMQIHWAVQSFEGSDGRVPKHPNGPKVDPTGPKEPFETQITGGFRKWHTTPNFRDSKTYENASKKWVESIIFATPNVSKANYFGWVAPNNALSTSKQLSTSLQNKTRKKSCSLAGLHSQLKKLPPATVPYSNVSQLDHNLGSEGRRMLRIVSVVTGLRKTNSWAGGSTGKLTWQ